LIGVYKLLPLEHRLSWLEVRLERSLKMLDLLLSNDEDMAAMYLTRYNRTGQINAKDHLKVELILETYVCIAQNSIPPYRPLSYLSLSLTHTHKHKVFICSTPLSNTQSPFANLSLSFSLSQSPFPGRTCTTIQHLVSDSMLSTKIWPLKFTHVLSFSSEHGSKNW
jgi:hypothetical protein